MSPSAVAAPLAPAGALLGKTVYNPAARTTVTASTSAVTDIDATNLKVTFVAPASGSVLVYLNAAMTATMTGSGYYWGLRVTTETPLVASVAASNIGINRPTTIIPINGLTPGTSYTYKWCHRVYNSSGTGSTAYGDDTANNAVATWDPAGPAIMEVFDAATTPGTVGIAIPYVEAIRTAGDITLNQTAITDVNTGLDLVLAAAVGDVIEYGISGLLSQTAQDAGFDVYTVVSAAPVNPFGAGLSASLGTLLGVPHWYAQATATYFALGGSATRTLVAGDISAGTVTMRLRYAKTTVTARTLYAQTNIPLKVWAKNLRH